MVFSSLILAMRAKAMQQTPMVSKVDGDGSGVSERLTRIAAVPVPITNVLISREVWLFVVKRSVRPSLKANVSLKGERMNCCDGGAGCGFGMTDIDTSFGRLPTNV